MEWILIVIIISANTSSYSMADHEIIRNRELFNEKEECIIHMKKVVKEFESVYTEGLALCVEKEKWPQLVKDMCQEFPPTTLHGRDYCMSYGIEYSTKKISI